MGLVFLTVLLFILLSYLLGHFFSECSCAALLEVESPILAWEPLAPPTKIRGDEVERQWTSLFAMAISTFRLSSTGHPMDGKLEEGKGGTYLITRTRKPRGRQTKHSES
jgi:hypothetical protein